MKRGKELWGPICFKVSELEKKLDPVIWLVKYDVRPVILKHLFVDLRTCIQIYQYHCVVPFLLYAA